MRTIIPIVEGQGEVTAVPVLLRKLLWAQGVYDVAIPRPINAHGSGGLARRLERFVELAQRDPRCDGVMVVQDGEGECPKELARGYVARVRDSFLKHPVAVVIARCMYEAWLVASVPTIMPGVAPLEGDPEALGDPKAWLDAQMRPGRAYKETTDQESMTADLDPELARTCRSFRRLESALDFLLDCIRTDKTGISPDPSATSGKDAGSGSG